MSQIKYQIIAIDRNEKKTVVNESSDIQYLDNIVAARDGFAWIGGEACTLEVVRA